MRYNPIFHRRSAFTLVELLTVIIIIGLLVALLLPAVMRTRVTAIEARDIAEISQLDAAMKKFKADYGALPPTIHNDDTAANIARVKAFWRRVWPRWDNSSATVVDLSPAEVMVFYLGGQSNLINTGASTKTTGFNLNPTNPAATGGQRSTPLFEFDQARLRDEDGDDYYEYYPPGKPVPYCYFDFTSYADASVAYSHGNATDYGFARPYKDKATSTTTTPDDTSGGFMNAGLFQIIAAGEDDHYGANDGNKIFPDGNNYGDNNGESKSRGDFDNLTNFATKRLEEHYP